MYSLQALHTFGLHANAKHIIALDDPMKLPKFEKPYWLLGEGSNCVFLDDFEGTVAQVKFNGIEVKERDKDYLVSVAAGENWHQLVQFCLSNQLLGFENLALIPGTVGAAPIQNIGAYGVEIKRFVERVECVEIKSNRLFELSGAECRFGYRDSIFKQELRDNILITKVHFSLPKQWHPVLNYGELSQLTAPTAKQIFDKVVAIRQAKLPDPIELGNAGSFFKNPLVSKKHLAALQCDWPEIPFYAVDQNSVKVPAAWLIDTLGFKGKRCGAIQCHASQPLVLTNTGGGVAADLLDLARQIVDKVAATFCIELENEVSLIGKSGLVKL